MLVYLLGQSHCLASVTALSQSHNAGRNNVELSCADAQNTKTKTLCLNVTQHPLLKFDSRKHQCVSLHAATAMACMCYG